MFRLVVVVLFALVLFFIFIWFVIIVGFIVFSDFLLFYLICVFVAFMINSSVFFSFWIYSFSEFMVVLFCFNWLYLFDLFTICFIFWTSDVVLIFWWFDLYLDLLLRILVIYYAFLIVGGFIWFFHVSFDVLLDCFNCLIYHWFWIVGGFIWFVLIVCIYLKSFF